MFKSKYGDFMNIVNGLKHEKIGFFFANNSFENPIEQHHILGYQKIKVLSKCGKPRRPSRAETILALNHLY